MNLQTTIVTAPRKRPTLENTTRSLKDAGFSDLLTFHDTQTRGQFWAYYHALAALVDVHPVANAYLVAEDDVVFCRGTRRYLDETLWPEPPEKIGFCSLYRPGGPRAVGQRGWFQSRTRRGECCCQAWVYPAATARMLLNDLRNECRPGVIGGDYIVSRWMAIKGLSVWFHGPSLAEHIAPARNSVVGNTRKTRVRTSRDFPGEDFNALSLLPKHATSD